MTPTSTLSIRARQALGASVVEEFCRIARLQDGHIDAFVAHLWKLACATDIPIWDEEGSCLEINGLGDPLPSALVARIGPNIAGQLARVLDSACEISRSQIYGAYQPEQSDSFLQQAIAAAGLCVGSEALPPVLADHDGGTDGWGKAIAKEDLVGWQKAARDFVRS